MAGHRHSEHPWRVRVDDEGGTPRGAGVLLGDRHVLTCAHVVRLAGAAPGGSAGGVRISSTVCHPEWSISARLSPDAWVYRNETRRGDVALLELDEPTPCGASTRLWRAPISGGRVRAYGFPRVDPYGIAVEARLAGSGGREGEWGVLNQIHSGAQWLEEGYSGAGVLALDGEFDGRVIGMVVADYVNGDAKAGWLLPTETMLSYLPQLLPYVDGEQAIVLPGSEYTPPDQGLDDPLRLALTQQLTRLLSGRWAGTVVVTGGATGTGTSWLARLVHTADPATRSRTSDAELSRAPRDTVLGLGAVDAAYDARGRSLAEVRGYLAERLGFAADEPEVLWRLLRREPPACLVIAAVDRAADPTALVDELLGPLARRAWSRGIRLVLGFDDGPPAALPYEVSLGPEPVLLTGSGGQTGRAEAEQRVAELSAAEDAAGLLQAEWGLKFVTSPPLPRLLAPQLRVQLAAASRVEPNAEFAAIHALAVAALRRILRYDRGMRGLRTRWEDLWAALNVNRVRAERLFGAEDVGLLLLHGEAVKALGTAPVDLAVAGDAVRRYADEIDRRDDEGGDSSQHSDGEEPR